MDANLIETIREKGVTARSVNILIGHGKRQGFLTLKDIVDCIPDAEYDEELLENILEAVNGAGVSYIETEEEREELHPDEKVLVDEGEEDLDVVVEEEVEDDGRQSILEDLSSLEDQMERSILEDIETDDMVGLYIKEAARIPLLSHNEEIELAQRIERCRQAQQQLTEGKVKSDQRQEILTTIERGKAAREHLIRANTRLVISVAKKYMNRGLPFLDLIQEGNIGLMRAIRHYDYQRGFKFSTYAHWWIRQAVTRALAEQSRTIRLPVHMSDAVNRMLREQARLSQELGHKPSIEELADALNLPPEKIEQMMKIVRQPVSLQTPVGEEDEETLGDFIEDVESPDPEESTVQTLMNEDLFKRLGTLPQRELEILQMRYGLTGEEPLTLNEIGRRMGITRERARQLEGQAIQRLRGADSSSSGDENKPGRKKNK